LACEHGVRVATIPANRIGQPDELGYVRISLLGKRRLYYRAEYSDRRGNFPRRVLIFSEQINETVMNLDRLLAVETP
jgi:hypothetical protein